MNKKDTRFQRKYSSNDRVEHQSKVWTICKDAQPDENKHVLYKICRGAWKKYVRGDMLVSV